jgi:hypothetical protein
LFTGGDKAILSQKDWADAVMTRLWEGNGGEHWYSATADRNVNMVTFGSPFSNGEYFSWNLGTQELSFQGIRFVFDNSTGYYNDIVGGTLVVLDGECIYVDLDRTQNATSLVVNKSALSTLSAGSPPGSRWILAWRKGSDIFTRGWRYPVGTLFTPATTTSQGVLKISRDYTGLDTVGTSGLNNPIAISDRGGTIIAAGTNKPGLTSTGTGNAAGLVGNGGPSGNGGTFTAFNVGNGIYATAEIGSAGYFVNTDTGRGITVFGGEDAGGVFTGGSLDADGVLSTGGGTNGSGVRGIGVGTGAGSIGVSGTSSGVGVLALGNGVSIPTVSGQALYVKGANSGTSDVVRIENSSANSAASTAKLTSTGSLYGWNAILTNAPANGAALKGQLSGTGGSGAAALWGDGGSAGYGAYGISNTIGVKGESTSGFGLSGVATTGTGVAAVSTSGSGVDAFSSTGSGVLGQSTSGAGVKGNSTGSGIGGQFSSTSGFAVEVGAGFEHFSASSPASSTGFTNTMTASNVPKAWGVITITGGVPTIASGFNIASAQIVPIATGPDAGKGLLRVHMVTYISNGWMSVSAGGFETNTIPALNTVQDMYVAQTGWGADVVSGGQKNIIDFVARNAQPPGPMTVIDLTAGGGAYMIYFTVFGIQ